MKLAVEFVSDKSLEQITIECVERTPQIDDICNYISSKDNIVVGKKGERTTKVSVNDIFYFEAVDEHIFAYTKDTEYEVKGRLFEIEESFCSCGFIRCSKSVVLNIYKTKSFSPALNGRFYAHLDNEEKVIVSRQYAQAFKNAVIGKKGDT